MGSIIIRSAGGVQKATIPRVLQASQHGSLSGEMTFAIRVPIAAVPSVAPGDVMSYGGEDYDIVRVAKRSASPQPAMDISGEHVSYRLNEAVFDAGTIYATPAAGLAEILSGTDFSVGTVQVTETTLLSFTSDTNVRSAVMQWAAACGAEILFSGWTVSLMARIGSTTPVELSDKKNVETVSVTLDARSDSQTYDFTLYKETALELGDAVTVAYSSLGLNASARVISIDKDPFHFQHVRIVTGLPVPSYVDSAIRAINGKVAEGKPYYGVTISRDYGIKIERSDGAAESIFNANLFAMRALIDGEMQDRIWFDPEIGDYRFAGRLSADALFTDSLYAELGFIAELTVDRLTTSRRVRKYLLQDTSDDNFINIQDHYQKFVTGSVISADVLDTEAGQHLLTQNSLYMTVEPPNDSYLVVQVTNRYGQRLYWQREIVSVTADGYPLDAHNRQIYATTEVTDWPVLSYAYAEQVKAEIAFEPDGQYYVPQIVLGAGDNHGNSRGYIYKRQTDLLMRYVTTNGKNVDIQFSDEGYVDALHRRLSYLHIMRDQVGTGGTIYYKVEGNNTMHTLEFVEIDGLLRYTWPDGHVCEVSVE